MELFVSAVFRVKTTIKSLLTMAHCCEWLFHIALFYNYEKKCINSSTSIANTFGAFVNLIKRLTFARAHVIFILCFVVITSRAIKEVFSSCVLILLFAHQQLNSCWSTSIHIHYLPITFPPQGLSGLGA
jgi:hypothetical protein